MNRRFTEDELKTIAIEGLPFVGQWLMSGSGALKEMKTLRESGSELAMDLETIRCIIRIRFLLSQSEKLCTLFKQIEYKASSHRVTKRENAVGFIKGRLDVPSYINQRHIRRVPKEYPCIIVDRELDTPENMLLCMTLMELVNDLTRTSEAIIKRWSGSAKPRELVLAEQHRIDIQRLLSSIVWAKPIKEAKRVMQTKGFFPSLLLRNAQKRLAKKRMRDPELYREFLLWLGKYKDSWAPGLVNEGSLASMLSYDSTAWHDRLFELYGTWKIAEQLSDVVGSTSALGNQVNLLGKHKQGPVFSFSKPQKDTSQTLDIRLYFQKAGGIMWDQNDPPQIYYSSVYPKEDFPKEADSLDEEPVEEEVFSGKRVIGIPDAILECEYLGKTIYMIVDFKNRFAMSQEHLVMTGYFHNFKAKMPSPYGFLIFRTRHSRPTTRLVINPGFLGVCFAGPSLKEDISPYKDVIDLLREACQRELGAEL